MGNHRCVWPVIVLLSLTSSACSGEDVGKLNV